MPNSLAIAAHPVSNDPTVPGEIPVWAAAFSPYEHIVALTQKLTGSADSAHDESHLIRVWTNAKRIAMDEGGDLEILATATLLHDCVAVEKNSPLRSQASRMAAAAARDLLLEVGWSEERIQAVAHAIEAHSFSARIAPTTTEARILQDADRLDALGAIGIARLFMVSGRLDRPIYDLADPMAENRPLDETRFALDHFWTKLLGLPETFQTRLGRELAAVRAERISKFILDLKHEIGAEAL
ncbi:HD domain-containing protein [Microvirga massiliensis]|uniref:HD domain-containing protein n=1 Tax=Microvirga massiliensis TaxID=1033741 RepID=UPI0009E4FEE8|nr:HD domain-containing protein [Microvirga massiliensis]